MSTVICSDEFDLDVNYKYRTVTIQAGVMYSEEKDSLGYQKAVPADECDSTTLRFEALPELILLLQQLVCDVRGELS